MQFDEMTITHKEDNEDTPSLSISSDFVQEWEIQASEIFCKVKNIGRGSFGTVYKGYYWGDQVAVKILNVKNPSNDQFEAFQNEVSLLQKARYIDHSSDVKFNIFIFVKLSTQENDNGRIHSMANFNEVNFHG